MELEPAQAIEMHEVPSPAEPEVEVEPEEEVMEAPRDSEGDEFGPEDNLSAPYNMNPITKGMPPMDWHATIAAKIWDSPPERQVPCVDPLHEVDLPPMTDSDIRWRQNSPTTYQLLVGGWLHLEYTVNKKEVPMLSHLMELASHTTSMWGMLQLILNIHLHLQVILNRQVPSLQNLAGHTKRKVVEKSSNVLSTRQLYGCQPKSCQSRQH